MPHYHDKVLSGFRAGLKGAQSHTLVTPDIITFGKVIGGGMPVGAFAARAEIMNVLSPDGPVYQAGTLSGNPIAMSAGLASLKQIKADKELYSGLEKLAKRLVLGLQEAAHAQGISLQVEVRGSMFGFFFNDNPVKNFDDALKSDTALFAKFHQGMLSEGVYFACSQFETGFICAMMDESMIDNVISSAQKVFSDIA